MGWLFCVGLFMVGCFTKNYMCIIASGLYAIAGAISNVGVIITKYNKTKSDE